MRSKTVTPCDRGRRCQPPHSRGTAIDCGFAQRAEDASRQPRQKRPHTFQLSSEVDRCRPRQWPSNPFPGKTAGLVRVFRFDLRARFWSRPRHWPPGHARTRQTNQADSIATIVWLDALIAHGHRFAMTSWPPTNGYCVMWPFVCHASTKNRCEQLPHDSTSDSRQVRGNSRANVESIG